MHYTAPRMKLSSKIADVYIQVYLIKGRLVISWVVN